LARSEYSWLDVVGSIEPVDVCTLLKKYCTKQRERIIAREPTAPVPDRCGTRKRWTAIGIRVDGQDRRRPLHRARSTPAPDRSFQRQVSAVPRIPAAAATKYTAGRPSTDASCPQSALCRERPAVSQGTMADSQWSQLPANRAKAESLASGGRHACGSHRLLRGSTAADRQLGGRSLPRPHRGSGRLN
jgi:hypothetical protein